MPAKKKSRPARQTKTAKRTATAKRKVRTPGPKYVYAFDEIRAAPATESEAGLVARIAAVGGKALREQAPFPAGQIGNRTVHPAAAELHGTPRP